MIIGDMEIRLRADIARLQRDMDDARRVVGDATAAMGRAAEMAKAALTGMAGAAGLAKIAEMSDQYSKLTAQLRLATDGTASYGRAYADVKRIAASSQADLAATASLYAQLSRATKDIGVSQKAVGDITEAVNLAFKISGAGAQETAGALVQLSQAFASGALRGDEFNSVNEAAPRLMQAIADGIGKPVGALRAMAAEGRLTAEVVATALPKALGQLQSEAGQIQTIAGAFTVLKNNAMEFVGTQAQASGIVSVVTAGVGALANNLGLVASGVGLVVGARLISWLSDAALGATAAVSANRALLASTVAVAESNAVEAAQASLAANARLAEVRAATLAAEGNVQLALTTNALIPAEARATAMAEAQSVALAELTVAQRAAGMGATALAAGTSALNGALALTGGPLGLLVTVLGGAALAWSYYGDKAEEGNAKAKNATEKSTQEIIDGLNKQNNKLRERIGLAKLAGMKDLAKQGGEDVERLAGLAAQINALQDSVNAGTAGKNGSLHLIELQYQYTDLQNAIEGAANSQKELQAGTDADKLKDWLGKHTDYLDKAGKVAAAIAAAKKDLGTAYNDDVEKKIRASFNKEDLQKAVEASKAQAKLLAELSGLSGEFSQDWSLLSAAYKNGKLSLDQLTKAQTDLLQKQPAMRAAAEAEVKARAEADRFAKAYSESLAAISEPLEKMIADAEAEAERNEESARTYGLTKAEIEKLTLARLEDQLAQRSSLGLTVDEIAMLEKVIEAKKRTVAALGNMEEVDVQKKVWGSIEQTAHDTFVSIFDSGKSAFDRLRDTLKNGLLELLYQMTLKQWLINIGASVTSGASGIASAGGSVAGAGGNPAVSAAANMASLFSTGGISGSLMAGAGWLTGSTTLAGSLGAAGSLIGTGSMAGIASGIGMGVGALGPIALGVAAGVAVLKKAFGMGSKEITSQGISGTLSADSMTGQNYTSWHQDGGWFRSDKSGTDTTALTDVMVKQFTQGLSSIESASSGFAKALGVNADFISSYSKTFDIKLTGDATKDQQAITDFFNGIGDEIAAKLVPNLDEFTKSGESLSTALQRLAGDFQATDAVAQLIGKTAAEAFGTAGIESAKAREQLIDLAGSASTLTSQAQSYAQNFLSEAERLAPVQKALDAAMESLGLSSVKTRDQFKAVVSSLDLTTEAGAKEFTSLMALADAFAQVHPATDAVAEALAQTNKGYQDQIDALLKASMSADQVRTLEIAGMDASTIALYDRLHALQAESTATQAATQRAEAVASERKTLQDQLDELTMSSAQLLEKQRSALDASNQSIFDQIQAVKAQQSAAEAAAEAIRAAQESATSALKSMGDGIVSAMDGAKAAAKALRDFNDALLLGNLSPLTTEEKYRAAKAAYEANPYDTQAAQAFLQASKDRGADESYYQRDFATVQANIATAAQAKDDYANSLPAFYRMLQEALNPAVSVPVFSTAPVAAVMSSVAASSQGDTSALEAKIDEMSDKLEKALQTVADNTGKVADVMSFVTQGGTAMLVEPA